MLQEPEPAGWAAGRVAATGRVRRPACAPRPRPAVAPPRRLSIRRARRWTTTVATRAGQSRRGARPAHSAALLREPHPRHAASRRQSLGAGHSRGEAAPWREPGSQRPERPIALSCAVRSRGDRGRPPVQPALRSPGALQPRPRDRLEPAELRERRTLPARSSRARRSRRAPRSVARQRCGCRPQQRGCRTCSTSFAEHSPRNSMNVASNFMADGAPCGGSERYARPAVPWLARSMCITHTLLWPMAP
eukprot:5059955-Prymnesium_polylepis.1